MCGFQNYTSSPNRQTLTPWNLQKMWYIKAPDYKDIKLVDMDNDI